MITKKNKSKDNQELSARKYVAISLLVTGMSQSKVAEKLEVTEPTVSGWMQDGRFLKVLAEQKNRILNDTVSVMVNNITAQKQLITKAVLHNVQSITDKINSKTTAAEHKAIAEALDKSLVSLEIAPRFNNKVEIDNKYTGRSPECIAESNRVTEEMRAREEQYRLDKGLLAIVNSSDSEPVKMSKKQRKEFERLMAVVNE